MTFKSPKPDSGCLIVGKVLKAQGLKGEIYIHVFSGEVDWLDSLQEFTLIDLAQNKKTMNKEKSRIYKHGFIVKPKELNDRNQAEAVQGMFLQLSKDFLSATLSSNEFYLREVLDFKLLDKDRVELGKIIGFSSNTAQDLVIILHQEKEYSIPLVEHWIVEVNKEEQFIVMDLPPGLIDEDLL